MTNSDNESNWFQKLEKELQKKEEEVLKDNSMTTRQYSPDSYDKFR